MCLLWTACFYCASLYGDSSVRYRIACTSHLLGFISDSLGRVDGVTKHSGGKEMQLSSSIAGMSTQPLKLGQMWLVNIKLAPICTYTLTILLLIKVISVEVYPATVSRVQSSPNFFQKVVI